MQPLLQLNSCVPRVQWVVRTVNKEKCVKMTISTPKLGETRKVEKVSLRITPLVRTNLGEGIKKFHEDICHISLRLQKFNKEWARLKRKGVRFNEEIRKIKSGVTQMGYVNLRKRELDLGGSPMILERTMTLLSCLQPYPTEWRSTECDMLLNSMVHEGFPQLELVGKSKPRTGGSIT